MPTPDDFAALNTAVYMAARGVVAAWEAMPRHMTPLDQRIAELRLAVWQKDKALEEQEREATHGES